MLQEQMRIKAGNGFTDSKREDAYVEDSGHFVVSDSTYTAGCDDMRQQSICESFLSNFRSEAEKKLQSGSACRSAQQILRQTQ